MPTFQARLACQWYIYSVELLQQIAAVRDRRNTAAKDLRDIDEQLRQLVQTAFNEGLTGPQIAAAAGLSQARIYQIRDGKR